jgi:phosphatidylserine/phosphatidylglycerophosphate/cardiolipin synthase-like enzyme
MADHIAEAQREVLLEFWDWDTGSAPVDTLLDGVVRLQRRLVAEEAGPVRVRLLVNHTAMTRPDPSRVWRALEERGLDPRYVELDTAMREATLLDANHVKTLVVDGRRAIVGSANATDEHMGSQAYFDVGFELEGEVARALHGAFSRSWARAKRWTCGSERPPRFSRGDERADPEDECWQWRVGPLPEPSGELGPVGVDACVPALVVSRQARAYPWRGDYDNPRAQAVLAAVAGARSTIRLLTPNLNEPEMLDALLAAAHRGVDVHVVLSKGHVFIEEDVPGRGGRNQASVNTLLEALEGTLARERLDLRWYSRDGVEPVTGGPPTNHGKYLSVDGQLAIVGSGNQDVQSWHNSREVDVVVGHPERTGQWDAALFEPVFAAAVPARYVDLSPVSHDAARR